MNGIALAGKIAEALRLPYEEKTVAKEKNHNQVVSKFGIQNAVRAYEELF